MSSDGEAPHQIPIQFDAPLGECLAAVQLQLDPPAGPKLKVTVEVVEPGAFPLCLKVTSTHLPEEAQWGTLLVYMLMLVGLAREEIYVQAGAWTALFGREGKGPPHSPFEE